jgi:hypothetical protein
LKNTKHQTAEKPQTSNIKLQGILKLQRSAKSRQFNAAVGARPSAVNRPGLKFDA